MVFSSLEFLFIFLPLSIAVYFALPKRFRNFGLLVLSFGFYAWGEVRYLPLLVLTAVLNYVFSYFIGKSVNRRRATRLLSLCVIFDIGLLALFKYADFILLTLSRIPALSHLEPIGLSLPIGISFYTFQAIAYVVDVYRGDVNAPQMDPIKFGTYLTMFPQLVAGPIVKYTDVKSELDDRKASLGQVLVGMRRFCIGLAKKVLIGNTAGMLWAQMRDLDPAARSTYGTWFGILCFTAQIYFDFSGYSDMAIGLGHLFGFTLPENFNYPYLSQSASDFWRRWHITLSSFFREYVYIPLGGKYKGKPRMYLNLMCVWLLTGLWHGAGWNFLLWGLYWFLVLCAEKAWTHKLTVRLPIFVQRMLTFLCAVFGWVIFAFDSSVPSLTFPYAVVYLKNMIGIGVYAVFSASDAELFFRTLPFAILTVIAATPYPRRMFYTLLRKRERAMSVITAILCPACLILCVSFLIGSLYNPFLYFRF